MEITVCYRLLPLRQDLYPPLALCLEEAGCQVTLIEDDASRLPERGCLLIWGNAAWYPRVRRHLLTMDPDARPTVAIWHCEPLPPPDAAGLKWQRPSARELAKILLRDARATDIYTNYFVLRQLARRGLPDLLLVSSRGRQDFLAERGIRAHHAPMGFTPDMGRDLGLPRDIDTVFLGTLDVPRRSRILQELEKRGVAVTRGGSWFDPAFWGEQRTQLLNRTKILLNFSRTPAEFSGYRLLLGMANKALVISEPIYNPDPYVPGKHFAMAPIEEIPDRVQHYLVHEEERRRIVEEAYRFALQEVTLQRSISKLLELLSEGAANGRRTA